VLERAVPLSGARFGLFLELNPELGLFGFAHAALFLFAARTLLRGIGFLLSTEPRLLFLAPPLRFSLGPPPPILGRLEPSFFLGRDARLLNTVQL
jgi:hypothetical protein